jgi:hypothetical protein
MNECTRENCVDGETRRGTNGERTGGPRSHHPLGAAAGWARSLLQHGQHTTATTTVSGNPTTQKTTGCHIQDTRPGTIGASHSRTYLRKVVLWEQPVEAVAAFAHRWQRRTRGQHRDAVAVWAAGCVRLCASWPHLRRLLQLLLLLLLLLRLLLLLLRRRLRLLPVTAVLRSLLKAVDLGHVAAQ